LELARKNSSFYASTCVRAFLFLVCESDRESGERRERGDKANKGIKNDVQAKHTKILGSAKTTTEAKIFLY